MQRLGPAYSTSTSSYGGLLGVLSSKYLHQLTPHPWNLADALKRLGYATCFLLAGDHTHFLGIRWMYGPSIDVYRDGASQTDGYCNDDRLVLDWLARQAWPEHQPVFLFLHLMSVHQLGYLDPQFRRWEAESAAAGKATDRSQALRDRYHDRILQADARLRQIFALLDREKAFKDALVIITADHGEYIGEYGRNSHGGEPLEPVIRIPLLIRDPAGTAYPVQPLSSLVDIAPTFLAAIGAPVPGNWAGIPLQQRTGRDALVVEFLKVSGLVGSYGGRRYKYFAWLETGTESLFDLDSPAGESCDLVAHPAKDASAATRDRLALAELRRVHAALTRM
jgi:arylsulfatase A-like enzyme